MGEIQNQPFQLSFITSLRVDFQPACRRQGFPRHFRPACGRQAATVCGDGAKDCRLAGGDGVDGGGGCSENQTTGQ